jgi:hypothetical protein
VYVKRKKREKEKNTRILSLSPRQTIVTPQPIFAMKPLLGHHEDGTEKLFMSGGSSDEDRSMSVRHLLPNTPRFLTDTEDESYKGFLSSSSVGGLRRRVKSGDTKEDLVRGDRLYNPLDNIRESPRSELAAANSEERRGSHPLSVKELHIVSETFVGTPLESMMKVASPKTPVPHTALGTKTACPFPELSPSQGCADEGEMLSVWDYFKGEFTINEVDEAQDIKTERLINFFQTPLELEKVSRAHGLCQSLTEPDLAPICGLCCML